MKILSYCDGIKKFEKPSESGGGRAKKVTRVFGWCELTLNEEKMDNLVQNNVKKPSETGKKKPLRGARLLGLLSRIGENFKKIDEQFNSNMWYINKVKLKSTDNINNPLTGTETTETTYLPSFGSNTDIRWCRFIRQQSLSFRTPMGFGIPVLNEVSLDCTKSLCIQILLFSPPVLL